MRQAETTEEQQHIVAARFGMIEMAWLADEIGAAQAELRAMAEMRVEELPPWNLGEFAVWWRRCGMAEPFPRTGGRLPEAYEAELAGDGETAAQEWSRLGLPYEAALALMSAPSGLARAAEGFDAVAAAPAAALARRMARIHGIAIKDAKAKRGPYGAARQHPLGLTGRESEVLELLAQGLGNAEIAIRLKRSPRTVEHHVSAVLGKFNAASRLDIMLRLRNEPWLVAGAGTENLGA